MALQQAILQCSAGQQQLVTIASRQSLGSTGRGLLPPATAVPRQLCQLLIWNEAYNDYVLRCDASAT
jgi:hypothetical protein